MLEFLYHPQTGLARRFRHPFTWERSSQTAIALAFMVLLSGPLAATVAANVTPLTPSLPQTLKASGKTTPANPYQFAPVKTAISSGFGTRIDPITQAERFHAGLDFAAPEGTPIYAPQSGVVVFSGWKEGYGHVVVIQHHPNFLTVYGHTSQRLVGVGDRIISGQPIALVGSTGRSTGPHLHFETIVDQQYQDPNQYLSFLNQHPPVSPAQYWATVAKMPLTPSASVNTTVLASTTTTAPKAALPTQPKPAAVATVPNNPKKSALGRLASGLTRMVPLPRALKPYKPVIQAATTVATSAKFPKAAPILPSSPVDGVPLPLVMPLQTPSGSGGTITMPTETRSAPIPLSQSSRPSEPLIATTVMDGQRVHSVSWR